MPHSATKTPPTQLLMNCKARTKLAHFPVEWHTRDYKVREKDRQYKDTCKEYHDRRSNAREHTLKLGDAVIVRREYKRKGQTPYEPFIYIVTKVKGSQIEVTLIKDNETPARTHLNSNLYEM